MSEAVTSGNVVIVLIYSNTCWSTANDQKGNLCGIGWTLLWTHPTKTKNAALPVWAHTNPLTPKAACKEIVSEGAFRRELSRPKRVSWLPAFGMTDVTILPVSSGGVKTNVFIKVWEVISPHLSREKVGFGTCLPSSHAVLGIEPSQRIIPSIFPSVECARFHRIKW